jgi:MFS family permease
VVGVGIATGAFGVLPTLAQVGIAAPFLFLVLRLVQGIFVGGVFASTHTIGTESVAPRLRGLMSGVINGGGVGMGALFASISYFVASSIFTGESFDAVGWRFMFFSGILSSAFGLYIFNRLEESPIWQQLDRAKTMAETPLKTLFSRPYAAVLAANVLIVTGSGFAYYLTSGYLPTFLKLVKEVPNSTASLMLIAASIVAMIGQISGGQFSEIFGRRRTFIMVGGINIFVLPVCYPLLAQTNDLSAIAFYSLLIIFLANAGIGPIMVFLNERFPSARQRDQPVVEHRIRAGRHHAEFRAARQRLGPGNSNDACNIPCRRLIDLPAWCRSGNERKIHLAGVDDRQHFLNPAAGDADAAAGVHRGDGRRGGVAGGVAGAAIGDAGDRLARLGAGIGGTLFTALQPGFGGDRLCRGAQRDH